ncbi:HD domain-containing protein [Phycicoccus sp. CSK15P-2]|uniref:HD-GYP domain-containing protein n=1 Tax=Phycicoccus sp. CSK15P-2 TaxID=2807627 RepID=UPI00194EE019|nr:HD domain-containing phosphohydrolase [Phycicoccus sp. CSK15P-2]MBM6405243.1 HD domain-containing protein [Phycicoccus sp. CSK15P-2]
MATRPFAVVVLAAGIGLVVAALVMDGPDLATLVSTHERMLLIFVGVVALGELLPLRMPSGRETAPLAMVSGLAVAFVGPIEGEPLFAVGTRLVLLVVAAGLGVAAIVRRVRGRHARLPSLAARLVGVSVAAFLARSWGEEGHTLWALQQAPATKGLVAGLMTLVAALAVLLELVLVSALRAERQRTPWLSAVRDELTEAAPITLAVVVTGPMVALMAPVLGLLALPAALVPLVMAYSAVGQYARNRRTNRQLIATLSRLTEAGGYTPNQHAERVAELSVRIGRVVGLGDRELRDIEYAALLHDLGQISLRDPIPDGATVLAAPADQRDIASEGARIIRHAETLATVATYVEGQTTPFRLVREHGEEVPMASRIIKCANAYDDLTGGSSGPERHEAAMERIHLGLGYEYDPEVVDALTRVVGNSAVGRVGKEPAPSR